MNNYMFKDKVLLTLLFSVFFSGFCAAQVPDRPLNYINDYSNILTHQEEILLNESIKQFEAKASRKIYVLIVGHKEEEDFTNYTKQIAQKWRVDQNEKDNSILLAFFYKKRKIRIEVGSELNSLVTGNLTEDIISYKMTPLIKQGEFYKATVSGVNALMEASMGKYKPEEDVEGNQVRFLIITSIIAFVFCSILFFLYLSKYKKLMALATKADARQKLESFHWKWVPAIIVFGIFFLLVLNYFTLELFGKNFAFLISMFLFFILIPFFGINLISLLKKGGLNFTSPARNENYGNTLNRGWV
jgi:uncharacterized membrane protein YgcG